jgi:hypothetical protein
MRLQLEPVGGDHAGIDVDTSCVMTHRCFESDVRCGKPHPTEVTSDASWVCLMDDPSTPSDMHAVLPS